MRPLIPAIALALALLFAACGETTIVPDEAANTVTELVSQETGFEPTDVECPGGVEAEVGGAFECTFTGPEGPYTADMEITEVDGEEVLFQVETHPAE